MVITRSLKRAFATPAVVFCMFIAVINSTNVFGQHTADTTKQLLLAAAPVKNEPVYIVKQANVTFPDILKGNEEPAGDYVANFSNNRRAYLLAMHEKGKKIMPKVTAILRQYNLPEELSVMMMLESACNANAVSRSGAVGYWQIMEVVARQYGLKYPQQLSKAEKKRLVRINAKKAHLLFKKMAIQKDERKNFDKSTITAARYLNDSRKSFDNNWLLVVASYNCGIGNVWNAIEKSGQANPDFWQIKPFLPAETQAYVMNFIALNVIFKNYDNFVGNNLNFTPVKMLIPYNYRQNMSENIDSPVEN